MVKINLLPYQQQQRSDSAMRKLILAVSGVAVLLLIIGSVHLYLVMQVGSLEEKLKTEEERLTELTKIAGEINQVKIDKKTVEKKLQIIKSLEENRLKPVILLDEITTSVPGGQIWLTTLAGSAEGLKLEGMARDNAAIARFMNNLEKTSRFSAVDLLTSKQSIIANTKLQAFTLSCALKQPADSGQAAESDKAPAKGSGKK
ncbi:MAG: PilN domain-containing protein [Syntrophaceae bacterium]